MKRVSLIAAAIVLGVLALLSARVTAQDLNTQQRTFMTFSNTVEMPGVTLPAGTYVFRLADIPTRNVVQVLSNDEKKVLGQWTFVQSQRNKVSGDTVVMFKENREGSMPAVQYWYYPGESIGKEFIYPKDQAQRIANRTGQAVLSEDGRVAASSVTSTDASGQTTVWDKEPKAETQTAAAAPEPDRSFGPDSDRTSNRNNDNLIDRDRDQDHDRDRNNDRSIGTSGNAEPAAIDNNNTGNVASNRAHATELPHTASPAPMIGLIGLLSLAAAFGTRKLAALQQ